jgi:hypothetical protein
MRYAISRNLCSLEADNATALLRSFSSELDSSAIAASSDL